MMLRMKAIFSLLWALEMLLKETVLPLRSLLLLDSQITSVLTLCSRINILAAERIETRSSGDLNAIPCSAVAFLWASHLGPEPQRYLDV